jgi:hypothetical protein
MGNEVAEMQAFQLTKEAVWYGEVRFSPDGLRCAAADWAGKVVIWEVDA